MARGSARSGAVAVHARASRERHRPVDLPRHGRRALAGHDGLLDGIDDATCVPAGHCRCRAHVLYSVRRRVRLGACGPHRLAAVRHPADRRGFADAVDVPRRRGGRAGSAVHVLSPLVPDRAVDAARLAHAGGTGLVHGKAWRPAPDAARHPRPPFRIGRVVLTLCRGADHALQPVEPVRIWRREHENLRGRTTPECHRSARQPWLRRRRCAEDSRLCVLGRAPAAEGRRGRRPPALGTRGDQALHHGGSQLHSMAHRRRLHVAPASVRAG